MEDAVVSALDGYKKLYAKEAVQDPLQEGIEKSPDNRFWDVTIGFNAVETALPTALDEAMAKLKGDDPSPGQYRKKLMRRYKRFRINAETGELDSMTIQDV